MSTPLQAYTVGLKLLLRRGDKYLLVRVPRNERYWDLPGGRINTDETELPLTDILTREVKEELGDNVQFTIGKPIFQFRRFLEHKNMHVFLSVFEGTYLSGDIKLSDEHASFEWLTPQELLVARDGFFNQEEFDAFQRYFADSLVVA